ncbi:uncharacterized protein [Diadema antillarum]|uniref:uncharacterized protein n=1 Tax=Diadema antillarum TaxID=105358 RepID=UPI003A85D2BC
METWQSCGTTGNITDTNRGDETSHSHGNDVGVTGRQDRLSSTISEGEERHSGETIQDYLRRMDQRDVQASEGAGGNRNHSVTFSRSTFGSRSELTSDSDYSEVLPRDSHPSDAEVFLPLPTSGSEQTKILEQRMRDLPGANQRCWKRVADYVNGLPIIPEPPHGNGAPKSSTQAKRQRIWSEGHERRRKFLESGSLSFAEGLTPQRKFTASSSSNFSQLSSLSSHEGSQQWFESADDPNQTLLPPTKSLPQNGQSPWQQGVVATKGAPEVEDQGTPLLKQRVQPKALFRPSSHNGQSQETARDAVDGYSGREDVSEIDEHLLINKDKLLQRRLTNSDLIALASQHRQRHRLSSRRQNLFHMGSSNVSEDSDTSGHSFSSIDDLLIARHDPEELLLNLGFGGIPEKDALDRIPSRFLQQPSQAAGISVESFLNQMDELERGCGFSLVGGLRSLGPALRRSTFVNHSPSSSRGSTPTNANEGSEDRTRSSTRTGSDERNNNFPHTSQVVFPETTVRNHTNMQSWRVRVQEEVGESAMQDVVIMTDRGQQTQDDENDAQRTRTSRTKVVLPAPMPPLDEENENSLRILNTRNQHVVKPEPMDNARIQRNQADSTNANIARDDRTHDLRNEVSQIHKALDQKSSKELEMVGEQIVPSRVLPSKQTKILRGLLLDAREDSLEFEELSSGDQEMMEEAGSTTPAPQADLDREGTLSRSESTQSDSSGFADEGVSSGEISSPHQASTVASDAKLTQTSFEGEAIELLCSGVEPTTACSEDERTSAGRIDVPDTSQESLELPSTASLEDSPFDDTIIVTAIPGMDSQRNRACTYPTPLEKKEEESGPKNVVEILSSLQSTSKELTNQRTESITSSSGRRRPPKLRKMRSVDPECYSYKSHAEPMSMGTASRLDVLRKISDSVIYEHQDSSSAETVDHVTHHVTTWSDERQSHSSLRVAHRDQEMVTGDDPGLPGLDHVTAAVDSTFREPHSVSTEQEVIPSQTEKETHRATCSGGMQSGTAPPPSTDTPQHLKVHRIISSETPHADASGPLQITLSSTSSNRRTSPELQLESSTNISSILPASASSPKELSEGDVRDCNLSVHNSSEGLQDRCRTEEERESGSKLPDQKGATSKSQIDPTNVNSTKEETHQGADEASVLPEVSSRLETQEEGNVERQGCHGDEESTSIVQGTLHEASISRDQAESIDNSESQGYAVSVCEESIQPIAVQDVSSSLAPSSPPTATHHAHEPQPTLPSSIVQDDRPSSKPSPPLEDAAQRDQVLLRQKSDDSSTFCTGSHDSIEPVGDEGEMPGRRLLRTLGGRSRIETISEEDHVKAREELRSLLMMEVDLISPMQKSSHRSMIHQSALIDNSPMKRFFLENYLL